MEAFLEPIKFPKTVELNTIFENSETETKTFAHNAKFLSTGKLIIDGCKQPASNLKVLDSFNIQEAHLLKGFVIKVPNILLKSISLLINDQIVEIAQPIYLDECIHSASNLKDLDGCEESKCTIFSFKIFNGNGVVQNPKLFDINFICEPIPSSEIPVTIQYYGIVLDEMAEDFLEYNQYYSIHPLNLKSEEKSSKVLAIYYSPSLKPNYNIRFLDLKDIEEFNNVVCLSYLWKTPVIFKFEDKQKKEKHRLITVECPKDMGQKLENDPILITYETKTVDIGRLTDIGCPMISKSFIVHKSERADIEGHLISEYGLIPYSIVISTPRAEVDYERMKQIYDAQMKVLKKLYGI